MTRPPRALVPLAALVALAMAGSFTAGHLLADPAPTAYAVTLPQPQDTGGTGREQASCEELLDRYVDAALPLVGPRGWRRPGPLPLPAPGLAVEDAAGASRATVAGTPGTTRSTASATGTNVQEESVDEPDQVKTDGSLLARVEDGEVVLADVSGGEVVETARVDLLDLEDVGDAAVAAGLELDPRAARRAELLLAGDTLVVLAHDARTTHQVALDVTDPAAPTVLEHAAYDAGLVSARAHGDVVRLVLAQRLPRLDFRAPGADLGRASAREANEELVRTSTLSDWLPARSVDGAEPAGFLDCADVAVPDEGLPIGTTTVVGSTAAAPGTTDGSELAIAADLPLAYESADHLYLATGGETRGWVDPVCLGLCRTVAPGTGDGTTHVVGLDLDGAAASYAASGQVDGRLADRWSMDEHDGVLRLALEATAETADATSVVTLEPRGGGLVEVGRLDGVGRGEDLTSVRWFDDLAVLVTFRRVDPLHTVDLSDPADPVEMDALRVPGFSSYLHPLGSQRLVGIGEGPVPGRCGPAGDCVPGWGAQAGLFDVTDLTDVRRLDVVSYAPGSRAGVADDPRQLTWLPRERVVLHVVLRGWRSPTAWVSALQLGGGRMESTTTRVERGSGVGDVRLVPLPDDRVVLVTGEDARFFDLGS